MTGNKGTYIISEDVFGSNTYPELKDTALLFLGTLYRLDYCILDNIYSATNLQ